MADERDENNNFSYYFKLFIKIAIFLVSIYYIFKYRATIRRYISILNRWLRFSNPLRNIDARFRNWREQGLEAQRQPLLDQIDREFQENLQPENFEQDNLQRGIIGAAAATTGGYVRNRAREIDQLEEQRTLPRRSGRVPNWTGPIRERAYRERRDATLRADELDLVRKREDRANVLAKTGGVTIPYLRNWLTQQGYAQPAIQDLQGYWDMVLGRTAPTSLLQPREPSFVAETSSAPLESVDNLDSMYLQRGPSPSSMLYQASPPPNFLDQQFRPVDFGKIRRRNNNRKIRR
jgi:hypothetical protein